MLFETDSMINIGAKIFAFSKFKFALKATTLGAASLAFAAPALAQTNWYAAGSLDAGSTFNDSGSSIGVGLAIGREFSNELRIEGEWFGAWVQGDSGVIEDVNSNAFFLNGIRDFPVSATTGFYAGLGVGGGRTKGGIIDAFSDIGVDPENRPDKSESGLAYQAIAGWEWNPQGPFALEFGVRYAKFPELEDADADTLDGVIRLSIGR